MKTRVWKVQSSKTTEQYYVSEWPNGRMTCSCPDFTHRHAGDGSDCKHIRKVRAGSVEVHADYTDKLPFFPRLTLALSRLFS